MKNTIPSLYFRSLQAENFKIIQTGRSKIKTKFQTIKIVVSSFQVHVLYARVLALDVFLFYAVFIITLHTYLIKRVKIIILDNQFTNGTSNQ